MIWSQAKLALLEPFVLGPHSGNSLRGIVLWNERRNRNIVMERLVSIHITSFQLGNPIVPIDFDKSKIENNEGAGDAILIRRIAISLLNIC